MPAAIQERWAGFTPKLTSRFDMALVEAQAEVEQAIAADPLATGTISAVLSKTQARVHGLSRKLEGAWEKMDGLFDELRDEDLSEAREGQVDAAWDQMRGDFDALQLDFERKYARWEMQRNADWARKLIEIANTEAADGPARALFYQGHGVHSICQEQAWALREAEQAQHHALQARRHPSAEDWDTWLQAARAFWARYYEVHTQMGAPVDGSVEQAIEGRLGQMVYGDNVRDQRGRAWISQVLHSAASRDAAALESLIRGPAHEGLDADCACEAIMERGDLEGAKVALQVKYRVEDEDEPFGPWLAEALSDLRRTVR